MTAQKNWTAHAEYLANVATTEWFETHIGEYDDKPDTSTWGLFLNIGVNGKRKDVGEFVRRRAREIGLTELAYATNTGEDAGYTAVALFEDAPQEIRRSLLRETHRQYRHPEAK